MTSLPINLHASQGNTPTAIQNSSEKSSVTVETSDKSKEYDTMTIMMINTISLEEQITKMGKLLEMLVDSIKEKDN